ncbi:hypothetical protein BDU57DRAFT_508721 [Ampelomyces quisqualis]|uniref:Phosphatidylethanolamine-binding protein n=1 Tax=Ampelomyces quisqualis TaxID=50730 RepID=A0A6A5QXA3_AMPQU|nr:hypothetical protein BDU57DRAFT_508721 [Ampelomyces quisqualis]
MLDLDAAYQDRRVSSLHWLVTGVTVAGSPSAQNPASLTIPPPQVDYQAPEPPIGDIAHTYAFYLIAPVPASVNLPASLATNRTPFDLAQFLLDARLENAVVARNHLRVRNLKGTPTAAFPAPRASETAPMLGGVARPTTSGAAMPTTGSTATFEGSAGTMEAEGRGALASLTALLMGLMAVVLE